MVRTQTYDIAVIGGGISGCTFSSEIINNGYRGRLCIIESGRNLGGRASSRISRKNKDFVLNHGSPFINFTFEQDNLLLNKFIERLLINRIIYKDKSQYLEVNEKGEFVAKVTSKFTNGRIYQANDSMTSLCEKILDLKDNKNQIDYFFNTLITKLEFKKGFWYLQANNGNIFRSKFIIISSSLILHKRSKEILNLGEIPLSSALSNSQNGNIEKVLDLLNYQLPIKRISCLIYPKINYDFKDSYKQKNRYISFNNKAENKYFFERIFFQRQKNKRIGLVIQIRNKKFIEKFFYYKNEAFLKERIINQFNILFHNNNLINKIYDFDDIAIMRWNSSQPSGKGLPSDLQFCKESNIGFCGDWIQSRGFGRIEGAIYSALKLSTIINNFI